MKKNFENPFCEVIRFGNADVVCTSGCCDVGGIPFDEDDEVCPGGDSHCTCYPDEAINCTTKS